MTLTFTQALCPSCWNLRHPDQQFDHSTIFEQGDVERCCDCGDETRVGLYDRIDPTTVPFPRSRP